MNRLYDDTLVLRDEIADLRRRAEAHQRVVEAWLAEKERGREQRQ